MMVRVLSVLTVFCGVFFQSLLGNPFEAYLASAMRKYNHSLSQRPVVSERISLVSAGNEWAGFQLVLVPCGGRDVSCRLEIGDLRSGDSVIPRASVTAYRVGTVRNATLKSSEQVDWADPLWRMTSELVVLRGGEIQPIWFDLHVPTGTAAGTYRGELTVRGGGHVERLSYTLRVLDFNLPVTPLFQTAFGFAGQWMAEYYGLTDATLIAAGMNRFLRNMLKHKLSPKACWRGGTWNHGDRYFLAPTVIRTREGKWRLDFRDYDRQLDVLLPLGLNSIMVGLRGWAGNGREASLEDVVRDIPYVDEATGEERTMRFKVMSEEHRKFCQILIGSWYGHLKARGLERYAYTYVTDEPPVRTIRAVNYLCGLIHGIEPKLSNMITTNFLKTIPMLQDVDIVCPQVSYLHRDEYVSSRRHIGRSWAYVACDNIDPQMNFLIPQSALKNRLPFWLAVKAGCTGFLYYETGRSMWRHGRFDPWKNQTWLDKRGTEGDGFLVYPGKDCEPVDSVRLKFVRLGIQDAEYFMLLRRELSLGNRGAEWNKAATALLDIPDSLVRNTLEHADDWDAFESYRRRIGELLEK